MGAGEKWRKSLTLIACSYYRHCYNPKQIKNKQSIPLKIHTHGPISWAQGLSVLVIAGNHSFLISPEECVRYWHPFPRKLDRPLAMCHAKPKKHKSAKHQTSLGARSHDTQWAKCFLGITLLPSGACRHSCSCVWRLNCIHTLGLCKSGNSKETWQIRQLLCCFVSLSGLVTMTIFVVCL